MTLHILSCSPEEGQAMENCLRAASTGDTLVLIGNGVYNAISPPSHLNCYALADDIHQRGLECRTDSAVTLIKYDSFVQLVAENQPICSWF